MVVVNRFLKSDFYKVIQVWIFDCPIVRLVHRNLNRLTGLQTCSFFDGRADSGLNTKIYATNVANYQFQEANQLKKFFESLLKLLSGMCQQSNERIFKRG